MRTLGRFYNNKILSREDISPREFLDFNGDSQIVRDLFGWKLYSGKKHIECRSHEEARFLEIFFEAGMDTVMVPADDNYLKSILPELERLHKLIEDAIGMFADGIMSLRLKEQLRRKVYLELLN